MERERQENVWKNKQIDGLKIKKNEMWRNENESD